jgi:hypothetical protein
MGRIANGRAYGIPSSLDLNRCSNPQPLTPPCATLSPYTHTLHHPSPGG